VNRPEALARPLEPDDEDDGNDHEGNEGAGTPPVAAGA
jgi:hypothetical protein